jgi:mycofactocin biosynthesis protein MftB
VPATITLDGAYALNGQVALRPEPFGALAYHYGNRRLVFLRTPELVSVVQALDAHDDLAGALRTAGVAERRWPSYLTALASLADADVILPREPARAADR